MAVCTTHLEGNLPNRYLSAFPHCSCLGPNLHSKDLLEEGDETECQLFTGEPVPFKFTLPLPILRMKRPPKSFLYGKDPGLDIVHRKARWKEIIQRELGGFLQYKRYQDLPSIKKELKRKSRVKHLPSSVVLLSKLIDYDPDDQFDGFFNWYYCGGCLCHVVLQEKDFLLRPGGIRFDRIEAVPIMKGKNFYIKPDLENTTNFDLGNKSPIYQIIADSENEYFGVRQGNQCKILSVMESSDFLRFNLVDECKTKSSTFTSIDFDAINKGTYATMDTAGVVRIKNVSCERSEVNKWTVPSCSNNSVDKWCCARYGQNRDSIICVNRQYIRTYDVRAKNMNTMEFCLKDHRNVEKCEEITCIVEGSRRNSHPLLYISTYHNLHGVDFRFPRAFVQRWTHGMEIAPSYACVACVDSQEAGNPLEVVILCSQTTNEFRAIVNHPSSEMSTFPVGSFFPVSLPTYSDLLKFGQWHGRLLNPLMQRRLSLCTVGMCCFEDNGGLITCLTQNSVGDVFQQHLVPKENESSLSTEFVVRHLKKWEKSLPKEKRPRKKLETVVRTDMKGLVKRVTEKPKQPSNPIKDIQSNWKISKKKLFTYTDMLAGRIREAWQLKDEPEWNSDEEKDDEDLLVSTQEPADKVRQWLGENNDVFTSTPMAFQGSQESDLPSFKPQLLESQFSECDNNFSPVPTLVQETKRRLSILESGRRKRQRVDGF